jgi:hypothetical protein
MMLHSEGFARPIERSSLLFRLGALGQIDEVREECQVVAKWPDGALPSLGDSKEFNFNSVASCEKRSLFCVYKFISFPQRESACCVEKPESGNLAVWTLYAVIVKVVSGLEPRVEQLPA